MHSGADQGDHITTIPKMSGLAGRFRFKEGAGSGEARQGHLHLDGVALSANLAEYGQGSRP